MKKLAFLLLLPLASCATPPQQAAENCDARWSGYDTCVAAYGPRYSAVTQMMTGSYRNFSVSFSKPPSSNRGPVYSRAGFGNEDWSPGYAH